ncbi:hypothetical protein H5410_002952 [Solanum commersonii]|uniref:Ribonuclease H1 N-terminal domain-containing protein n=1 Tax=Solanum commersonii TaxID=4109 RepID=A0A9J6B3N7_SOLCO|nr:hypothetical protein H5410_002952 [Solanum commersonii]
MARKPCLNKDRHVRKHGNNRIYKNKLAYFTCGSEEHLANTFPGRNNSRTRNGQLIEDFQETLINIDEYMSDNENKNEDKKFRFHVVVQGKLPGVFQTWIEVINSIKDFPTPLFKGFNDLNEALDYARGALGPNYFISPALKQISRPFLQYNIQKDTDEIILCDHYSSMTEGFKRLNQTIERLETEKGKMTQHIHSLQERIRFLLGNTNQTTPLQIQDYPKGPKSSPSHYKMDKTGVHSPTNVESAIVSARGTTSPVQMIAGRDKQKDKGIPTKKKKNKRIEKIITSSIYKLLKDKEKAKEIIQEKIIQENPKSEPEPTDSDLENTGSRSDENDLSIDQFTQHYDPNEDNDSRMSFDSIALHNLDT